MHQGARVRIGKRRDGDPRHPAPLFALPPARNGARAYMPPRTAATAGSPAPRDPTPAVPSQSTGDRNHTSGGGYDMWILTSRLAPARSGTPRGDGAGAGCETFNSVLIEVTPWNVDSSSFFRRSSF